MSEKLYKILLKLYPDHFRRTYGDEALRLVRDRAMSEKGRFAGLRLWMDLSLDLARSLPQEYGYAPRMPMIATEPLHGEGSFQTLADRSLNPTLLCLGGALTAALFWICVFVVAHSNGFPVLLRIPLSLQGPAPSTASNAAADQSTGHSVSAAAYSFCMSVQGDIPGNSAQPLFVFHFAPPGASGLAIIDGKTVKRFKNEQRLSIRAHVSAGDHQFVLHLERPAETTFMSSNADFEYCRPK